MKPDEFPEAFRLKATAFAHAEADAMRAEKKAKRIYSQLIISMSGSINQREHEARTMDAFVEAEEAAIDAATKANVLKGELESMRISWETWRSLNAQRRAEMKL